MKARQVLWPSWPLRLVTDRTINQCSSGGAWYGRESGSRASKYWHLLHFVATISAPLTEPLKNDHKIPNNNKTRRADKINVFSILLISNILSICVGGSGGKPQKSPQWKQIVPAGVESAKGKMQNTQENTTATTTKEAAHREEEKKKERKGSTAETGKVFSTERRLKGWRTSLIKPRKDFDDTWTDSRTNEPKKRDHFSVSVGYKHTHTHKPVCKCGAY